MLKIDLIWQGAKKDSAIKHAALKAARTAAKCEKKSGGVSLLFTNDEDIHALNREFRQVNNPTDVLSFPSDEPGFLGDIAISVPCAVRQAQEYGHSVEREIAFLTVHAMLHLFGYDHMNENDEDVMRSRQRDILAAAGMERL